MFSSAGWDGVWLWECNPTPSTCFQMGRNFTAAAAKRRLTSVDIPKEFSDLVEKSITATDFQTQKQITWQLEKEMVDNYAFLTFIYVQQFSGFKGFSEVIISALSQGLKR